MTAGQGHQPSLALSPLLFLSPDACVRHVVPRRGTSHHHVSLKAGATLAPQHDAHLRAASKWHAVVLRMREAGRTTPAKETERHQI